MMDVVEGSRGVTSITRVRSGRAENRVMRATLALLLVLAAVSCGDDRSAPQTCTYHGVDHPLDMAFPAGDGCNACFCPSYVIGAVECTTALCLDGGPPADVDSPPADAPPIDAPADGAS
jgi:hypothetical protein